MPAFNSSTRPSSVSLIQATSYDPAALTESLQALLAPLGGMAAFVKSGDRVLLKPNLLTGARPGRECTTRPEVVYCVAQLVQAAGGKPFIGDGPAFGSARGVALANGYESIVKDLGLPIIDFQGRRYETAGKPETMEPNRSGSDKAGFANLLLSKEAMEADVVINLPKVKSHVQLTLTLGVKNLFGCVPGKMKAWWHLEAGKDSQRFGSMLVETARTINPELTILDGIIGHQGNGPSQGEPRPLGLLAASANVFALDRAMLEVLATDPAQVPTVAASQRLGVCPKLSEIQFPLLSPGDLRVEDWKLPDHLMPIDFGLPRVLKSTFRHLYIRFIKEPFKAYAAR